MWRGWISSTTTFVSEHLGDEAHKGSEEARRTGLRVRGKTLWTKEGIREAEWRSSSTEANRVKVGFLSKRRWATGAYTPTGISMASSIQPYLTGEQAASYRSFGYCLIVDRSKANYRQVTTSWYREKDEIGWQPRACPKWDRRWAPSGAEAVLSRKHRLSFKSSSRASPL